MVNWKRVATTLVGKLPNTEENKGGSYGYICRSMRDTFSVLEYVDVLVLNE